jgi:glycerophosphoryl diester phosphodiesterase
LPLAFRIEIAMRIRPLLLGHRGARAEKTIPENTVPSFDRALAGGCDGFELDVRLSADGQAVICHDPGFHGLEIAHSSAEQLVLPLLGEVLARYQSSAFLDIELKVPGLEEITVDLLRGRTPARGYVVSSFLPEVLRALHEMDATIPLGLICETRAQLGIWPALPVAYVIPVQQLVAPKVIAGVKAAGKKILVWTVNVPSAMRRLSSWQVDGIISDVPARLAATLSRKSGAGKR